MVSSRTSFAKEDKGKDFGVIYSKFLARRRTEEALADSNDSRCLAWMRHSADGEERFERVYAETDSWDPEESVPVVTESGAKISSKGAHLELRNPPRFDNVEDFSDLTHLNEPSVLDILTRRYQDNRIYSYSGIFLVAVNPYKEIPIYSNDAIKYFRGKSKADVAPHIFSVADLAYRSMLEHSKDQSILITGESGAGKTESTKKVIKYLATVAGNIKSERDDINLEDQILSANPILEAFGNAKTLRNNNSSRFGKFMELQFNPMGCIAGVRIRQYLLEKSRVVKQIRKERNYNIFYQFLSGASPEEVDKYQLKSLDHYTYTNQSGCYRVEGLDDAKEFHHTKNALNTVGVNHSEQEAVFRVLSAILHLGNVQFVAKCDDKAAIVHGDASIQLAAQLLHTDPTKLEKALLERNIRAGNEMVQTTLSIEHAEYSREALAKALYGRVFEWIVACVNDILDHEEERANFIGVLDISGFEIFESNSFEQLCINYTNEKLQQYFNHYMFTLEQEEYMAEKIQWDYIDFGQDLQPCIDLIEKPVGILAVLDEECVFPKATDETFTEKVVNNLGTHPNFEKPRFSKTGFSISHYAGQVYYDTQEFLLKNKDPLHEDIIDVLRSSSCSFVNRLFGPKGVPHSSHSERRFTNISSKGRRSSIMRHSDMSASGQRTSQSTPRKQKSAAFMTVGYQYKDQLALLMQTLNETSPHFVRCIVPNAKKTPGKVQASWVLEQLRCNGVLEGIRISRKGYPTRETFQDFVKRYGILNPSAMDNGNDHRKATELILSSSGMKPSAYQIGLTKVFFRCGEVGLLEKMRGVRLSSSATVIQKFARGWLARRECGHLRVRVAAVKLLQRNVRAWLTLRHNAWWKLFMMIRPLITPHRLDKELKEHKCQVKHLQAALVKEKDARQEAEEMLDMLDKKMAAEADQLNIAWAEKEAAEEKLEEATSGWEESEHRVGELEGLLKEQKQSKANVEAQLLAANANNRKLQDEVAQARDEVSTKDKENIDLEARLEKAKAEAGNLRSSFEEDGARLQEQLSAEKSDKSEWKRKCRQMEVELEQLKRTLEDTEREKVRLQSESEERANEVSTLKNKLSQETSNSRQLASDKAGLEESLDEKETALESLQKMRKSLESHKTKGEEDLVALQEQLDAKTARVAELEGERSKLTAHVDEHRGQLSDSKTELLALQEEVRSLKDQLEVAERSRESVEQSKKRVEAKLKSSEEVEEELSSQLSDLKRSNKKLEGELKSASARVTEVESSLEDERKSRQTSSDGLRELEKKLMTETSAKQAAESQVRRVEAELQLLKGELEEVTCSVETLEKQKRELRAKCDDLCHSLEDSREDMERQQGVAERERARLEQQVSELRANMETMAPKVDSAALAGLEEMRERVGKEQQLRASLEAINRKLTSSNKDLGSRLEEAEEKRSELQRHIRSLEKESRLIKQKLDDQTAAVASREKTVKALEEEKAELVSKVAEDNRSKLATEYSKRDLELKVEELTLTCEEKDIAVKHAEASRKKAMAEAAVMAEKLDAAEASLDRANKAKSEMESGTSETCAKLAKESAARTRLEGELKLMGEEYEQAKERVEEGEKVKQHLMRQQKQAERELVEAKSQLIDVQNALKEAQSSLQRSQEELDEVKQEQQSASKGMKDEVAARKGTEESLEAATIKVETLEKSVVSLEKSKSILEGEVKSLRAFQDEARATLEEEEATRNKLLSDLEQMKATLSSEVDKRSRAEQEMMLNEAELEKLRQSMDNESSGRRRLSKQRRDLEVENSSLKQELEKEQLQNFHLQKKVETLDTEKNALEKELEQVDRKEMSMTTTHIPLHMHDTNAAA